MGRPARLGLGLVALPLVLATAMPAAGQTAFTIEATGGSSVAPSVFGGLAGAGARSAAVPMSRAELDRVAELLGLDAAQREIASALHGELLAASAAAEATFAAGLRALTRPAEGERDLAALMEEMPKLVEARDRERTALDAAFLSDLRLLLTAEQEERWPAVERLRRRSATLAPGTVPGEAVDLVLLVEELELRASAEAVSAVDPQPLRSLIGRYEVELDRALVARNRIRDDAPSLAGGRMLDGETLDALRTHGEELREAGLRLRDINRKYVGQLATMLAPADADRLRERFRALSYPEIAGPSSAERLVEAALALEDLDTGQRAGLERLAAELERTLAAANDDLVAALEDEAEEPERVVVASTVGGGSLRVVVGGGALPASVEARRARREVDRDFAERVRGLLREVQRERLPRAGGQVVIGPSVLQIEEAASWLPGEVVIEVEEDG